MLLALMLSSDQYKITKEKEINRGGQKSPLFITQTPEGNKTYKIENGYLLSLHAISAQDDEDMKQDQRTGRNETAGAYMLLAPSAHLVSTQQNGTLEIYRESTDLRSTLADASNVRARSLRT